MIRAAVVALVLVFALCCPVQAAELETAMDFGAEKVRAAVPTTAKEALEGLEIGQGNLDEGLERLFAYLREHWTAALRECLRPLAAMVAVCLLCSLGDSFSPAGGKLDAVTLGGCLAIAAIGVKDMNSVLALGRNTLTELLDFSRVLLPTLTTAAAVTGAAGSAGAAYAAAAWFSDLLLMAEEKLIMPMICAFAAANIAAAVLGDKRLDGIVAFLQWGTKTVMKLTVLGFTAYLSLSGILAGAADAATVKAAKSVISTALPVVGKLMADAAEALVAGAGVIRGAVGIYGLLACMAIILLPVLRLGLRCLLFRAAAAICSGFGGSRQLRLISGLSAAYAMLLGLIGTGAAIEFLAVFSLIRTVMK